MINKIKSYIIKTFDGMAKGLFSSLLVGLIMIQIGELFDAQLLVDIGKIAQLVMGPAIGIGIAIELKANKLTTISAAVLGAIGAGTFTFNAGVASMSIGEPVGALISALIGVMVGRIIEGTTSIDILIVPMGVILSGGLVSYFVGPYIVYFMTYLGSVINNATMLRPVTMGLVISVLMGIALTLPISSAAIAISLGLNGLAAGAAAIGCASNMIGFAVGSYKENGIGGLISQGLGTSMIQLPNIVNRPIIWIPSILTSAILGPVSTSVIPIKATPSGAGMGTSGLVGVFSAVEAMGSGSGQWISIITMMFIAPAIISLVITQYFRNKNWIKTGDMKLNKD